MYHNPIDVWALYLYLHEVCFCASVTCKFNSGISNFFIVLLETFPTTLVKNPKRIDKNPKP